MVFFKSSILFYIIHLSPHFIILLPIVFLLRASFLFQAGSTTHLTLIEPIFSWLGSPMKPSCFTFESHQSLSKKSTFENRRVQQLPGKADHTTKDEIDDKSNISRCFFLFFPKKTRFFSHLFSPNSLHLLLVNPADSQTAAARLPSAPCAPMARRRPVRRSGDEKRSAELLLFQQSIPGFAFLVIFY